MNPIIIDCISSLRTLVIDPVLLAVANDASSDVWTVDYNYGNITNVSPSWAVDIGAYDTCMSYSNTLTHCLAGSIDLANSAIAEPPIGGLW